MQASLDNQIMTNPSAAQNLPDGLILGLESSGAHASVAIIQNHQVINQLVRHEKHGHAVYFVDMAADCLAEAGFKFTDLTAIAAGIGPGSFTGLRTCLSAAKGFVLASDIEAWGINGLRARAFALHHLYAKDKKTLPEVIIATADTRRGPYFWQAFDAALNPLGSIQEAEPQEIASQAHSFYPDGQPIIALDAAKEGCHYEDGYEVIDMFAKDIGLLAAQDRQAGMTPLGLEPLYAAQPKLGPSVA